MLAVHARGIGIHRRLRAAALQHQRSGPISTRIDLGYILSPIGLGMLDMRPDTNPTIMPHLSYLVPMPGASRANPPGDILMIWQGNSRRSGSM